MASSIHPLQTSANSSASHLRALRFLLLSPFQSNASITASNIGPSCPQQPLRTNAQLKPGVCSPTGGNQTEFFPLEPFSEDCLTLNIWTPQTQSLQKALPVFVWFFGGGFLQGETNALYYNPQSWVQRTQEHIVMTVNFRSNIFGFPNAAGLTEQNLGLLDQRMALEWVRDNIASFGGDAANIVGWGESAGATAWNYLDFAFPRDPSFDSSHRNFSTVAKALGCGVPASELDCMNVSWQNIESVVEAIRVSRF
jgi:acetylcholinesterase